MINKMQNLGLITMLWSVSFLFGICLYGNCETTSDVKIHHQVDSLVKQHKKSKEPDLISPPAPKDTIHPLVPEMHPDTPKFVTHVTLTTYQPVVGQCDADPLTMANNKKIDLHKLKSGQFRVIAVSRDLLKDLPFDSVVEIEGHGRYVVSDVMNKRFKHYVDILIHPSDKNTFKKTNIKITKIA